jgi:DNA-binding LacI/PurR family transcriptional regulator
MAIMHESTAKATIQDIAWELNITASAVFCALWSHVPISDATKIAVRKTVRKLHYHHNKIESSLRLVKSEILSVIIPSTEINFSVLLLKVLKR